MTIPRHYVTATHLASVTGASRPTAAKLARDAGVREVGGKFDPEPALTAIRAGLDLDKATGHRLIGNGARLEGGTSSGLTAARERQALASAEAREIANAERRKQLVEREAVVAALADIVVRVRSTVLAVASKSAPKVAKESDPARCRAILESDLRAALSDLAAAEDIHRAILA